jgi:hypothetical protein
MQLGVQRPGKPMWFGIGPQGQSVFGLPGNPVSTLVCLTRYVIPAIAEAMGTRRVQPERLALASPVTFQPALTYFLPVTIVHDDWGPSMGESTSAERFGRFLESGGNRRFRGTPTWSEYLPQGLRDQGLPLVAENHGLQGSRHPRREPPARPICAAAARLAYLGDGPLQFPLPVLHAERAVS